MTNNKILTDVQENLEAVIAQDSELSKALWQSFLQIHPADIADFLSAIPKQSAQQIFGKLPKEIKMAVFEDLSDFMQGILLEAMSDQEKLEVFRSLPTDELADLFDHLSDEELKRDLKLLAKDVREHVLSLLQFEPESAGGIMTTDVLTLMQDFTVEQSIKLLQRVQPKREIHQQIFVVDSEHNLLGHINLTRINTFMRKNELVARADQDQEQVAKEMVHYGLMTVPVVSSTNKFLGVISSEQLMDVLVQEATEDVQRMASLPPMKYPYFEIPLWKVIYLRSYVLIALLIAESFSGTLLRMYDYIIKFGVLGSFLPMLTSAGGNSGTQTSAVVIQGLASGEITFANMFRLLRRELFVSFLLATILGALSFARAYWVGGSWLECLAIGCSLTFIVLLSSLLGSIIPFVLRRFNIDPAFSAGPFLATLMDILSIVIYCHVSNFLLKMAIEHSPFAWK
jgi:magnesium transporter